MKKMMKLWLLCITILSGTFIAQEKVLTDSKGNKVPDELMKLISVSFDGVDLSDAVHEIAAKGGFHLNYNQKIILSEKKLYFKTEKQPAFLLLKNITKDFGIDLIVLKGKQIVFVKQKKVSSSDEQTKYTISGYVTDAKTGEALINTNIYIKELNAGTVANNYGFYSITLNEGTYLIKYSFISYDSQEFVIELDSNIKKDVVLNEVAVTSDTIVVVSQYERENVFNVKLGSIKLIPEKIKTIPMLLGEHDILKTLQMLPGISNYREGDCGLYVRGGNSDQNLILLDEAPIYSAFHTFGLFSVFNSEAINKIDVMKGTAPAKYGGRISSVIDMQMKEGNMKEFKGDAGIGLIFSRLMLQAPIYQDKASFLISGRRTYLDGLTGIFTSDAPRFYFYDLNAKINYKVSDKDRIYLSGYFGRDGFGFEDDFDMVWGNTTATLRWNHLFSDKLFLNSSLIFSNYRYETNADIDSDLFEFLSKINNVTVKEDFEYFHDANNTFGFGLNYVYHSFLPASMSLEGDRLYRFTIGARDAHEANGYLTHELKFNEDLKIDYGLRLGMFSVKGEKDIYNIREIAELNVDFHGAESNTYFNLEPRFEATYKLNDLSSIKGGFSRNYQYLHLISNSNSGLPLDIWQPSSSNMKPQRADQISFGYFHDFDEKNFELSIEGYYKDLQNQVEYKDGANFILKSYFESELVFGKGWASGLELLLKKNVGDLTGWLSYCLSTSQRQFDEINSGRAFPARNDKTHELNLVIQYQLSSNWKFSANWIYSSGFTTTIPFGKYVIDDQKYIAYTDRNGYRFPSYQRLDLGISYVTDGGSIWNFSLFNALGRKNIYTVLFRQKNGTDRMEAVKLTLFSTVPSLTYSFSF